MAGFHCWEKQVWNDKCRSGDTAKHMASRVMIVGLDHLSHLFFEREGDQKNKDRELQHYRLGISLEILRTFFDGQLGWRMVRLFHFCVHRVTVVCLCRSKEKQYMSSEPVFAAHLAVSTRILASAVAVGVT